MVGFEYIGSQTLFGIQRDPFKFRDFSRILFEEEGYGRLPEQFLLVLSGRNGKGNKCSDHLSLDDRDILERAVSTGPACGGDFTNRIDNIHSLNHLPKDRVFGVQVIVVDEVDEELGPASVGTGIRHRYRPAVVPVPWLELVRNRISWSPATCPGGVSALDHEAVNDAVEYDPIVVSVLHKGLEIPCRDRHGGIKGYHNRAHVRLKLYLFP